MSKKHRGKQRYQTFITVVVAALTLLLRLSQFTSDKHGPLFTSEPDTWVVAQTCAFGLCMSIFCRNLHEL